MSINVAVVTGAGRGIGRATALALATLHYAVALVGRTASELEETADAIKNIGGRSLSIRCDVAREADVDAAKAHVLRDLGVPLVVVNNAGIVKRSPLQTMSAEDFDDVVAVNLRGTFLVTRAFLPSMMRAARGRFVAVGSISSTLGTPNLSAYCASKWAVVGMMKSLAEELHDTGLQAMCVLPGSVDTEMLKGSGFPPRMTPEDVANTIVYLAIDAPSSMNGSAVEIFGT